MSVFSFGPMRAALPDAHTASRPIRSASPACLPSYAGLHSNSLPLRCSFAAGESRLQAPQNGARTYMMRHGRKVPRLGRPADQRKALLRALTTEVLRHGSIKTTEVKAKAVRKYVDKMIQLAKRGDLHARRQVLAFIYDKDVVSRLFDQVSERYAERNSGYCRIKREAYSKKFERVVPIRARRGDNARIVSIELV